MTTINMLKIYGKVDNMHEQKRNFNKEIRTIRKNQMECQNKTNLVKTMMNARVGSLRLDTTEERISQLEERSIEITQTKTQTRKKKEENPKAVRQYQTV